MSPRNPAKPVTETPTGEPIDQAAAVAVAEPEPKPQPPKAKTPPPSDLIAEELGRERRLAEAREALVFRRHTLLADGLELSSSEMRLLQAGFGKSATENEAVWRSQFAKHLRKEDSRVGQILDLQRRAGTPADQTAADTLVAQTAAKLDAEAPAIEEQIVELQNQLGTLHQAASNAKMAATVRHDADKNLRDPELLPQFIHDELAAIHREHTQDFGRDLLHLETRRTQIQSVIVLDVTTPEGREVAKHHVGGNPRFGVDEFTRLEAAFVCKSHKQGVNTMFSVGNLREDRWSEYVAELSAELIEVEGRIDEITTGDKAAADREVESLKSFYLPE